MPSIRRLSPYTRLIWLAGVVLSIAAIALWWNMVYQNPRHIFSDMLTSNFSTSSLSKHIIQTTSTQQLDQYIRFNLGSNNASQWLVDLSSSTSSVETESIGTPSVGYVRYLNIQTSQKSASGKPLNFNKIFNIWGKSDVSDSTTLDQLFNQTVIDINNAPLPPIGNLTAANRNSLINTIQQTTVFSPDYNSVKHTSVNGRSAYVFSVSVKIGPYLNMMKTFARDIGLHNLDSANPNDFKSSPPITLNLSIDALSHQLIQAAYPAAGYQETYTSYGQTTPILLPNKTIPISSLEIQLQTIQQS